MLGGLNIWSYLKKPYYPLAEWHMAVTWPQCQCDLFIVSWPKVTYGGWIWHWGSYRQSKERNTTNYPVHGSHKINCLLTVEILLINVWEQFPQALRAVAGIQRYLQHALWETVTYAQQSGSPSSGLCSASPSLRGFWKSLTLLIFGLRDFKLYKLLSLT